jgi:hypothetical protein
MDGWIDRQTDRQTDRKGQDSTGMYMDIQIHKGKGKS